jgi:hypothetical protein
MSNTLKLVLTDHWFEEIKSGRKTHEYRKATPFWAKRIYKAFDITPVSETGYLSFEAPEEYMPNIEFQKAYRKNPERMTFKAKSLERLSSGINTDLRIDEPVFVIELGDRIDE